MFLNFLKSRLGNYLAFLVHRLHIASDQLDLAFDETLRRDQSLVIQMKLSDFRLL
jgi:hypothetical protein